MASDPKRILRSTNLFFRAAFANLNMNCDADDQMEILEQELVSNSEGPPSPMTRKPAHAAARSTHNLLTSAEFRATVRLIAQEEAKRIQASRNNASTTRAVGQALFDAFQIGDKSANVRLNTTSYHFSKSVLTEMAHREALEAIFDRTIE